MKKRKTYEVSVINKTYSKTYSDQTKFYTSDTALELNFQLKEVEYDFDSAEIILLNVDDRSLVTRPVGKSAEGFTYELEDDIVERYGEWKGQLKFTEGGEVYVSSPVVFRIENDLTNDRPPQLTEVNNWKTLRAIADGLIADIRSEIELVSKKELEREQAESERQNAEIIRIENENQRKTDHANRSDELAGKADKVVLENLIPVSSSMGHNGVASNVLNSDTNEIEITLSSLGVDRGIYHNVDHDNVNDALYVYAEYLTKGLGVIRLAIGGNVFRIDNQGVGAYYKYSAISMASSRTITFYHDVVDGGSYEKGDSFKINKRMIINLTQTFGVGNEPTKEEMDELIKLTGYIDGEYALNNKEMLIWTLSLVRSNRNAIISLGGTI